MNFVRFFGGKLDGEEIYIDDDDLRDVYRIPLDIPETTPCIRQARPNDCYKVGTYCLRELWRNDRPSFYMYVYENNIDEFNKLYGE